MHCVLPTVLSEQLINSFTFHLNNQSQQGIRHNSVIYGLVSNFSADARLEAYQLSYQLAQSGASVVITVSGEGYQLWVDLSASEYLDEILGLKQDLSPLVA